jgi:hypothetical protein
MPIAIAPSLQGLFQASKVVSFTRFEEPNSFLRAFKKNFI